MNGHAESDPVDQILLARLLVAGDKGATATDIRKALEPLAGHRWAGSALTERIGQALAHLESANFVSVNGKGKSQRWTLTGDGRQRALERLGIEQLPAKTTWDKLRKTHLAALALGLPAPEGAAAKGFSGEPGFKAALLRARYELPLSHYPKIQDALDALSWTLLGLKPGPKFTVKAVQSALILRELGIVEPPTPKTDPKKEAGRLLARDVGAQQSGKDELRLAAIRHWVDGGTVSAPIEPPSAPPPTRPSALDLETFARRVVEAARMCPTGHFGIDKVFVNHVWQTLSEAPDFSALGSEGFKHRLAEANNARLLDLSRADMVEAMDAEDVRLSEVAYLGAAFHFIRI